MNTELGPKQADAPADQQDVFIAEYGILIAA
jgi:hypothetical protein